jgi:SAM-dependent methyltransferase
MICDTPRADQQPASSDLPGVIMSNRPDVSAIAAHYARQDPTAAILAALQSAGKNIDALEPEDLTPVDQFHSRGRPATLDLAAHAGLAADMRVLDVGGGIGGAARTLAQSFGCEVTVLDLTEAYCRAGEALTARVGLSDRVRFRHGSALDIPFADASFDLVWTQHSSMNVADKARLYGEIARVLRPGARFALHEIMAGPGGPVHFPVPWARTADISHLLAPEPTRQLIASHAMAERVWIDETPGVLAWFEKGAAAAREGKLPPVGLHLLLGPEFGTMFANQVRNLREDRIRVVQAVFERR